MRAMRGNALETVPFQPYFWCTESFLKALSNKATRAMRAQFWLQLYPPHKKMTIDIASAKLGAVRILRFSEVPSSRTPPPEKYGEGGGSRSVNILLSSGDPVQFKGGLNRALLMIRSATISNRRQAGFEIASAVWASKPLTFPPW